MAFVFNAANSVFLPVQRLRRVPTAVHVDGLEWQRSKWGRGGRLYYRMAESLAVRWADALVADARGIAEYYDDEFGVPTELITYGAPIQVDAPADLLDSVPVESRRYHLVVARFEPENHVLEIVEGYRRSAASQPLLVVGSAPYANEYTSRIHEAAAGDPRIRLLGGVWDQRLLDQLYAHALTYLHGHSVGGTNPSLLRAMGAGTAVWPTTWCSTVRSSRTTPGSSPGRTRSPRPCCRPRRRPTRRWRPGSGCGGGRASATTGTLSPPTTRSSPRGC